VAITRRIALDFDRLVIVEVDRAAGTFRKRAETDDEAERLRHEAQVLEVARHPGVVELVAAGADAVTLRLVDGEPLSERTTRPGDELVVVAAAAAGTLADLHDIGVVHGSITAEHIVIDRRGQPVFCSFGRGAIDGGPDAPAAFGDVAALARTLAAAADPATARWICSAAAKVNHGRRPARRLATRLAADTPTRRIPAAAAAVKRGRRPARRLPTGGAADALKLPSRRHRRGALLTAAVAAAALLSVALVVLVAPATGPSRASAPRPVAPPCPAVDQGCRPILRTAGVVTVASGRYRIGDPGDQVVVGRWHCRGALPALLQPATGEVWAWDSWAGSAGALPARLLTRIPDARAVSVDPVPSGCDRLLVRRRDGEVVVIRPAEGA
jgi:tRNA A-37 threonylcarbamoyl transferase component Bud32